MERWQEGEKASIAVAVGFGLAAVIGYAVFGAHPGRITPNLVDIYAAAFKVFAQGQVWVTALALGFTLWRRAGWQWVNALLVCYAISLTSELMGTTFGVPFGAYQYSSTLGPMWLARVPVIIPLSWFLMALPSYALARGNVFLGSLILLAWDLVLDPAMSYYTRYWQWHTSGPYFGMPLLNLFGWYVTGLALLTALKLVDVERWTSSFPRRIWALFYSANVVVPAGIVIAAGLL